MSQLLDPNYNRASILPLGRHKQTGKLSLAVPGIAADLLSALMLPGDVYHGNVLMNDPETGRTNMDVIKRSADLAGAMTLGSAAMPAQKNAVGMGIRAYHGTPHDFDRFDMDKIGTGEGAQAYGHGLYFAENEGVAKAYKEALSGRPDPSAAGYVNKAGGDKAKAVDLMLSDLSGRAPQKHIDRMRTEIEGIDAPRGRMYEVEINANPDEFLDWDAMLADQPKPVLDRLRNNEYFQWAEKNLDNRPVNPTGGDLHRYWEDDFDKSEIADILKSADVKGIKFKDAGSRGKDGDGTRNYVIFDDKLISIVRKYGLAGAVAAGIITQQQAAQMQAQGDI